MEDIVSAILPMRHGKSPIMPGQRLILRLVIPENGLQAVPDLLAGIGACPARGDFSPQSMRLLEARDAIGGTCLCLRNNQICPAPEPLTEKIVRAEIGTLVRLNTFTLRFCAPLRLTLPENWPGKTAGEARFCHSDFFHSASAFQHLITKIRFYDNHVPILEPLEIIGNSLRWNDMRYNKNRRIALGGVVGELTLNGTVSRDMAARIVLGQYLGAGKNGRFGLGFWRVLELDGIRSIQMP